MQEGLQGKASKVTLGRKDYKGKACKMALCRKYYRGKRVR